MIRHAHLANSQELPEIVSGISTAQSSKPMTRNGSTRLVHSVLSGLLVLALQTTRATAADAESLPQSVQAAIDQCERLEYAEPQAARRIADHGLTLDPQMTPAQRGRSCCWAA